MSAYGAADLVATRDVAYTRTLRYKINDVPINWAAYTWMAQARLRDGSLVFDLTPFFQISPGDPTALVLTVPADMTYALPKEAKWDLLAWQTANSTVVFRTPNPPGRVLRLSGVTQHV